MAALPWQFPGKYPIAETTVRQRSLSSAAFLFAAGHQVDFAAVGAGSIEPGKPVTEALYLCALAHQLNGCPVSIRCFKHEGLKEVATGAARDQLDFDIGGPENHRIGSIYALGGDQPSGIALGALLHICNSDRDSGKAPMEEGSHTHNPKQDSGRLLLFIDVGDKVRISQDRRLVASGIRRPLVLQELS